MSNVVLPPTATNPGLVVNNDDHYDHGRGHGNMDYGYGYGGHRGNDNYDHAAGDILNSVHGVSVQLGDASAQTIGKIGDAASRLSGQQADAALGLTRQISGSEANLTNRVTQGDHDISRQVGHSFFDVSRQLGHIESALSSQINQRTFDISVNIEKVSAAQQVATERIRAELTLQAAVNSSKNELLAAQNAASIAKQLAECCCEIKALVLSEAGATRDLTRDIEARHVRDQLADAKMELLLSKTGK